jgi:peptide/nickel transport system permease protein
MLSNVISICVVSEVGVWIKFFSDFVIIFYLVLAGSLCRIPPTLIAVGGETGRHLLSKLLYGSGQSQEAKRMWQYILKRVLLMIPTLLGAALIVFLLMNIVPGDIALLIIGGDQGGDINPQELARLREKLGLNRPLYEQFFSWLWNVVQLDFGNSLWTGAPVIEELKIRFPLTLEIAVAATILSTLIAIPLGTLAAIRQDTWVDYAVRVLSIGGLAIPSFWTGILVILFLVLLFEWSPPLEFVSITEDPWENFKQLVWPIVTVGYRYAAVTTRMTRSTVLEVLREDYIRTAWAKGLQERMVVAKHTLKNAVLPVITIIGTEFAFLIGGLVVTETVFTLNGVGSFVVDAIAHRDIPVVQSLVLLIAFAFVFVNLIIDLLYAWIDPRISYR